MRKNNRRAALKRRRKRSDKQTGRYDAAGHVETPSSKWQPMVRDPDRDQWHPTHKRYSEWWENWRYYCNVTRFESGFFVADSAYTILGISSLDETARHDWREFQRIKNDICGADWEGVELYPDEHRLVDPSNRFYLYCVPSGVLRFGNYFRRVWTPARAQAPQRPFHRDDGPDESPPLIPGRF